MHRDALRRHVPLLLLLVLLSLLLSGCSNFQVRAGSMPDLKALEENLVVGKSTIGDVLSTLGEPYGVGQEMIPLTPERRELFSYYYEEGSSSDDRRIFLFVFLKDDVYDGYMWFSSL